MDKAFVTITGAVIIGFIYWFFFGKKEIHAEAKRSWNVAVSGGYNPSTITVPHGKPVHITFTRTDTNNCLEDVYIEDFKIKQFLPMNKSVTVTISPIKPGVYPIHCGMNMFHGKIKVI